MKTYFEDAGVMELIKKAPEIDPYELSLQLKKYPAEKRQFIATQVAARKKAKEKIPEYFADEKIGYPSTLAVEQASSSLAAGYKANMIKGGTVVDMTGGLGVDAYFFSRRADKVIYLEKDPKVATYALHNFGRLKTDNVYVVHSDSLDYLNSMGRKVDYIYLDPSRRPSGRRVFRIEDAEPDAVTIHGELLEKAGRVIIKLSPLLDLSYLIQKFRCISAIHVLAIERDCREIILILDKKNFSEDPSVVTWSCEKDSIQSFAATFGENESPCGYEKPGKFIYDPNVAIRKSGLFNALGRRFGLKKLAPNSHLYTADKVVTDFPGRIFILTGMRKFSDFKRENTLQKANISTRNFRLKPDEIRKRTRIGEGGDVFLFFTTIADHEQVVLYTEKTE